MAKEKHPIALHHPSLPNYGDHRRVEKDSKEHVDLVDSDPLWREAPYTEQEIADFKNKKTVADAAPKRSDFRTVKEFKAALEKYEASLVEEEE